VRHPLSQILAGETANARPSQPSDQPGLRLLRLRLRLLELSQRRLGSAGAGRAERTRTVRKGGGAGGGGTEAGATAAAQKGTLQGAGAGRLLPAKAALLSLSFREYLGGQAAAARVPLSPAMLGWGMGRAGQGWPGNTKPGRAWPEGLIISDSGGAC